MIDVLGKKGKSGGHDPSDLILAFVRAWDLHRQDETTICAGVLDILRAYLGERPCCLWKKTGSGLSNVCERGMVEIFFNQEKETRLAPLNRALITGTPEFDGFDLSIVAEGLREFDGFLHVPLKLDDDVQGALTLAVRKKEAREVAFVTPLEGLTRLVAIAIRESENRSHNAQLERRLRSEVEATTKELELTNKRLIERVKELKTLYSELEERVKELTVANRAKDEFISIISHELRTPLTSLNGFLCVVLDEEAGPLTDEQKKFLNIAKNSADRLKLMIADLLDISRLDSGRMNLQMANCQIFDLLQKAIEVGKSSAESKGVLLKLNSIPTLPIVWGDATRLQQVIDCLVANAIKFSERQGIIILSTEEKGDYLQVAVSDQGPGLTPEEASKVFDVFYQAESSLRRVAGGAGLGLSIAKGIISLHGGEIWVESEKGKGSIFKFMVPRSRKQKVA